MFGPDDFASRVHGNGRFLATELNEGKGVKVSSLPGFQKYPVTPHLDGNRSFVVTNSNVVGSPEVRDSPNTLHAVVQGVFQTVGVRVPDSDGSILTTGDNDGEFRVETGHADVLRMSFERLNTALVLVVPNLDQPGEEAFASTVFPRSECQKSVLNPLIVSARDEVRLVTAMVVVDGVDALFVSLERVVGHGGSQRPNLLSRNRTKGKFK